MDIEFEMQTADVSLQYIDDDEFKDAEVQLTVLRLDKIHPVVSGNKWFKLKYYLQQAIENNYESIATFGGAFSNHILATAYICYKQSIPCTGYIRGERPGYFSHTLTDARALNMRLEFLSREDYSNSETIMNAHSSAFFIPEGGYGNTGARGASEIAGLVPEFSAYNYIICAAGTGTMLAGIANASMPHQECIGISIMKNNRSLENEIRLLVIDKAKKRIKLLHDYHFGGYAKYTKQLIDFMNTSWIRHGLPLDFVYTAKALYAVYHLAAVKYFTPGSKILFIHSGGLQGNRSLANETLLYH